MFDTPIGHGRMLLTVSFMNSTHLSDAVEDTGPRRIVLGE